MRTREEYLHVQSAFNAIVAFARAVRTGAVHTAAAQRLLSLQQQLNEDSARRFRGVMERLAGLEGREGGGTMYGRPEDRSAGRRARGRREGSEGREGRGKGE